MTISLIAAMSENRVIGKNNQLPWHLPEDLKRFRQITSGHPVIMGRKTFESMRAPLPKRENIVITRNPSWQSLGVTIVHSLDEAIEYCNKKYLNQEIFVIGGGEIYRAALSLTNRIYLTVIHLPFEGDAYFPELDLHNHFQVIQEEKHQNENFSYSYLLIEKRA